jgi:hypothetical protein
MSVSSLRLLVFLALAATAPAVLACANGRRTASAEGKHRALTLALPRAPASDEAVALRVKVGILPRGARVVVRLPSGEIVGSVSPFGVLPGRKAGASMIPLPAKAIENGKVQLIFEVEEKGRPAARPPTKKEMEAVELVFLPVTP